MRARAPAPERRVCPMSELNSGNGPLKTTVAAGARITGDLDLNQLGAMLAASEDRPQPTTPEHDPAAPSGDGAPPTEPDLSQPDIPPADAPPSPEAEVDQPNPEDAPAEDADPADDDEPKALTPEEQAGVNKRIGKEVGRRKEAEKALKAALDEVATLRAQLEAAPAPSEAEPRVLLAEDLDPLKSHPTLKPLREQESRQQTEIDQLTELHRRLRRDPDQALADLQKAGAIKGPVDPEDLREQIEQLVADKRTDLASVRAERSANEKALRRQLQQAETQFQAEAKREFAWLGNKADPRQALAQQIVTDYPVLKTIPFWPFIAAGGAELLHRRQQPAAAPKAPVSAAPARVLKQPTVRPTSAPASPSGGTVQALMSEFNKTGSRDTEERLLHAFMRGKSI